jgi:hypothetical protein
MSTGRPCVICSSMEKTRIAAEMIADGASDQAIATRIGGLHRMAVNRHRRAHVVLPPATITRAKGRRPAPCSTPPLASPPRPVLPAPALPAPAASASSVPPTASAPTDPASVALGVARQAEKLARVEDRLERMATLAEQNGSPGQVATLSAAQLRAVETGAKLAGVGGFAPQKAQGVESGQSFVVNFHFSGARTETVACGVPAEPAPVIDGGAEDVEDDEARDAPPPPPEMSRRAAAFGPRST